jgi:YVTN family beta-propeller protein
MRFRISLATILSLPLLAAPPTFEHQHLMMVVSKGMPGITIYDADSGQAICRAKTGVSPHEAAFSLDGQYAYVPVYGSTAVGLAGTDEHVLHFFRTSDCSEAAKLDTGENKRPHGIAVGKSGNIYLTSEVSKSLLIIDPNQHRIIATIPTDSPYSHMIAVTPDEKTIFVSNVQSKTVSVLDVPDRKLEKVIQTGAENQRMTLSPDGRWFVTSLGPEKKIAFYRTSDDQLDFTVPVDGAPFVAKFSADGKFLYDAGHNAKQVRVWKIDVAQKKIVGTTTEDIGSNAGSLTVDPFNGLVYVSDQTTNKISEIDPATWKVTKTFATDQTPDQIVFAVVRGK